MKRFFILLALCITASANATTMCVSDLSSCTSCTDSSYSGVNWSKTCCGVTVSGIGVNIGSNNGLMYCYNMSFPATIFSDSNDVGACTCIMQKPVVADYWFIIYYGTISWVSTGLSYDSCAQACAEKFYPQMAFERVSFDPVPGCTQGSSGGYN